MKIGQLNAAGSGLTWTTETYRTGGRVPFPPEALTDTGMKWTWQKTMLSGVEYHICFEKEIYVAVVRLELGKGCGLYRAEVLTADENGEKCVGVYHAENGKAFYGTVRITTAVRGKKLSSV